MRLTAKRKVTLAFAFAVAAVLAIAVAVGALSSQPQDVESPVIGPRTPIPGAAKAGLFADGVTNLAKVDTAGWKTYSNVIFGYSFMYPPTWEIEDRDNQGHKSADTGEPAYPLQAVTVKNPASERGENQAGVNCTGITCMTTLPKALGFYVAIENGRCTPGDLIIDDKFDVAGKSGSRCVVESPNDNTSRVVHIAFPRGDGRSYLVISFERGRAVTAREQAILETILSTFKFSGSSGR